MPESPKDQLMACAAAISTAVAVLKSVAPTMSQLLAENERMENVGPVLCPSLYRDPERRSVASVMVPLCRSSLSLIATHDQHVKSSQAALAAVKG